MPISNLTQPTDTVKDYRPSIPKRVKYKPKDRETIIKLPGRKPTVVRSKNEVVKSDNRSNEKKQLDWKHDEQTRARYLELKNSESFKKLATAMGRLYAPSTYAGAVARSLIGDGSVGDNLVGGEGFGDPTTNIVFDLAFPVVLKYGSKAGSEFLQNSMPGLFDPYSTFRGSLGYHGNSLMDRIIGTYGRKLHLPVKSRMPELFRAEKRGINLKSMTSLENQLEKGRFPWQNLTTDTVVRDHGHGHWSGSDVVVKNPNMYDPKAYLSTQPSDTFILKGYNNNPFDNSNYTIVSGNTELLKEAKEAGFETLSTPKLRKAYDKIRLELKACENQKGLANLLHFRDISRSDVGRNYTKVLRGLLRKRGSANYSDYRYQSQQTGLPLTVSRNPFSVPGNIRLDKVVGNDNLIFYDRSTPLESTLRNLLNMPSSGMSIEDRMTNGYCDFLRNISIDLNKKLYLGL